MTSRERIRAAMEFGGPDRAPIQHYVFPGAFREHGRKLLDLLMRYPDDFGNEGPLANWRMVEEQGANVPEVLEYTDAWGTGWRRSSLYTAGEVIKPGLPSWDNWTNYRFPQPPGAEHFEWFERRVREKHPQSFVVVAGGGLFQHIQNLRGPADFFLDIADDRQELHELLDKLVEYHLPTLRRHLAAGADCANWGDDWGTQTAMLCSPDDWRRIFKPHYQRLFEAVKEAGAKIWIHSDGWILDILPDLVEMGVDLINPQHPCMGTRRVGEAIGGKVCVRTDIDRQAVIPFGTAAEVRAAVEEAMDCFGRQGGGIMFHGEVGPNVPFENIEALYESFYEVGRYP